jgi:hypothetical protein
MAAGCSGVIYALCTICSARRASPARGADLRSRARIGFKINPSVSINYPLLAFNPFASFIESYLFSDAIPRRRTEKAMREFAMKKIFIKTLVQAKIISRTFGSTFLCYLIFHISFPSLRKEVVNLTKIFSLIKFLQFKYLC